MVQTWTNVFDMDSWHRHGIMVQTWTHGIDKDSWYRHGLMVLTTTHCIHLDSWYSTGTLESHTYKRAECCPYTKCVHYKPHYHPQGHVSPWCKEHCNPRNVPELNSVNTVICEQVKFLSTFPFTDILHIFSSSPSISKLFQF